MCGSSAPASLPDTTRPRVSLTVPATTIPGPTAGVATNAAISAVFTEDMAPATISASSFTLACAAPCVAPAGTVSYVVGNRTAVFTPAAALAANTTYVATITTAATDLAGNALAGNQAALPAASNYVWSFTTAAVPIPPANISVQPTSPVAGATGVCTDASVNATFTVPSGLRMDPATINSGVFTLAGAAAGDGSVGAAGFGHRPHRHLHARRRRSRPAWSTPPPSRAAPPAPRTSRFRATP